MSERENNARGNILQPNSENIISMWHQDSENQVPLWKCKQIPSRSGCISNSTFKGKYVLCLLLQQNQHNSIYFTLWHFELAWVQKFSTSTYITKLHSKFISSSTTCMNSFFVLFVAVSASLSLMKFHSAFPAVHEHHSTTTALVSETLKENVKHWLT